MVCTSSAASWFRRSRIASHVRREFVMTLFDNGWTEDQAKGLIDSLKLTGGVPDWKPEHLQKLHDWCKAQEKDAQMPT
jgi:hypothetical protein